MSENKDARKTLAELSSGFSTGTGLKLWLFFLFCFYFMGYPVALSILLGAAGGLAAGWVFGWWKSKDEPMELKSEKTEESEETSPRRKVSGLRLASQRRSNTKSRRRSEGLQSPWSNFWKK
jgi:hypothetical protein